MRKLNCGSVRAMTNQLQIVLLSVVWMMHHRGIDGNASPLYIYPVNHGDAQGESMKVRDMAQLVSRIEPDIKAWLERKAQQEERSQNWLVGKALREAMQRDEQIKQA